MSNNECNIKCSFHGCDIKFGDKYYSSGMPTCPVKDDDKHFAIIEGLCLTRLFCMKHSQYLASKVCNLAKIKIPD